MGLKNCWDDLKCGRQNLCPAYPDNGRNCFAVTATLCHEEHQGSYEEKIGKCRATCGFYRSMMEGSV
jgi:methyl-accepting chemotaxis protein